MSTNAVAPLTVHFECPECSAKYTDSVKASGLPLHQYSHGYPKCPDCGNANVEPTPLAVVRKIFNQLFQ